MVRLKLLPLAICWRNEVYWCSGQEKSHLEGTAAHASFLKPMWNSLSCAKHFDDRQEGYNIFSFPRLQLHEIDTLRLLVSLLAFDSVQHIRRCNAFVAILQCRVVTECVDEIQSVSDTHTDQNLTF